MSNDFYCPYNLTRNDCRCCEDVVSDLCCFGNSSSVFFMKIDKAKYEIINSVLAERGLEYAKRA